MKLLKAMFLTATMAVLSACSSTSGQDDDAPAVKATSAQVQELENKVGDRVFFAYDSTALTTEAQNTLNKQAAFMSENSDLSFNIEGHADESGTREYNLGLGERRANVVKQFLVGLGVGEKSLTVISYGKERPAVVGANEFAWSQNRRGVTVAR